MQSTVSVYFYFYVLVSLLILQENGVALEDIQDSLFAVSSIFGKHLDLKLPAMDDQTNSQTYLKCASYCAKNAFCAAIVWSSSTETCKLYTNVAQLEEDVEEDPDMIYLLRCPNGNCGLVHNGLSPAPLPPPFQVPECGSPSCIHVGMTAAFRHRDGSFILVQDHKYYQYTTAQDMCNGNPSVNGDDLTKLVSGFIEKPEMTATTHNGKYLFVFKNPDVYCYMYHSPTQTYTPCEEWQVDTIQNAFGSGMPSTGDCFIAQNNTYGYLFQGDRVYTSSNKDWQRSDSDPNNVFHMSTQAGTSLEACTDTSNSNYFLFFDQEEIWVFDVAERKMQYVGKVCK